MPRCSFVNRSSFPLWKNLRVRKFFQLL
jgi:hypothetical protein